MGRRSGRVVYDDGRGRDGRFQGMGTRERVAPKLTVEGLLIRDVVDKQDAHGSPVVRRGDGAEALLARRVPDLQLDALAVELDGPDLEVDADGRNEGRRERILAKPQEAA